MQKGETYMENTQKIKYQVGMRTGCDTTLLSIQSFVSTRISSTAG
jgi:hypothetical protein